MAQSSKKRQQEQPTTVGAMPLPGLESPPAAAAEAAPAGLQAAGAMPLAGLEGES